MSQAIPAPAPTPPVAVDLKLLEKSLRRPRSLFSFGMSVLCGVLAVLASVPLFSVLIMLLWRGGSRLSVALFTDLPPAAGMIGGGIGNAILGSVLVVLIASLISIPFGILGGVYLAEISPEGGMASMVRFCPSCSRGCRRFWPACLLLGPLFI